MPFSAWFAIGRSACAPSLVSAPPRTAIASRCRAAGMRAPALCALAALCLVLVARARGQVQLVSSIATTAGNGTYGYSGDGGLATSAELSSPSGVVVDSAGNVFLADYSSNVIREVVAATGNIETIAGNGTAGYSGDGGAPTSAELNQPYSVAVDSAGNVYIADYGNNLIREVVAATGKIQTVAGNGTAGYSGDGSAATSAELNEPIGVAVDSAGNLYIADFNNNAIREVVAATGNIQTVAGNGTAGYTGDGAAATSAQLNGPESVALDSAGNIYIADYSNNVIREVVAATADIETIAGKGSAGFSNDGGLATGALLNGPIGVAVSSAGNVYIDDFNNVRIREVVASTGKIYTIAGNGTSVYGTAGDGGPAVEARFDAPLGLAVDSLGSVYIADSGNSRVREISNFTAFPTTAIGASSATQNVNIELVSAQAVSSIAAAVSQGNKQEYTVGTVTGCNMDGVTVNTAATYCTVPITFSPAWPGARSVPLTVQAGSGNLTTALTGTGTGPLAVFTPGIIGTYAGNGNRGSMGDGGFSGDGGPATSAELSVVAGVAVDSAGNVYIVDRDNQRIREVVAATGKIKTIAGNGTAGYNGDNIAATSAELDQPLGVAADGAGNIYIADSLNQRIREVVAATGKIETIAGNGTRGYNGDNIAATAAELNSPAGVAVDSAGNVYIVDTSNTRIREVVAATGYIQTIAGNGTFGDSGDGGPATSAELQVPAGVATDSAGNVYIADSQDRRVREVVAATGIIQAIAGNGTYGYSGDGGAATSAELENPSSVATDSAGNVYIADTYNQRVREVVAATGYIQTIAGNGTSGYSGDGGSATGAELYRPDGLAVDSAGDVYIADELNFVVRRIDVSQSTLSFAATAAGQTSTDSPQQATVQNVGNQDLIVQSIAYGTDFPEDLGVFTDCSDSGTIPFGNSCTLTIDFSPLAASGSGSSLQESVTLTDNSLNATNATQSVTVSGTETGTVTQLAFGTAPASNVSVGGNAGSAITVREETSGGSLASWATDTITLTVTYPDATQQVYTQAAAAGAATFDLSGVALTELGKYSYAATLSGVTGATASETVSPVTPTFTWNPPSTIIDGDAGTSVLNATVNCTSCGGITYTAALGAGSPVSITSTSGLAAGVYTITAIFTSTSADYNSTNTTATLTISGESVWVSNQDGSWAEMAGNGSFVTAGVTSIGGKGIAIDASGNVWGVGSGADGLYQINQVGTAESAEPDLASPDAIAADGASRLWVVNTGKPVSLFMFNNTGTPTPPSIFTDSSLSTPSAVAIDLGGSVWVANQGNNSITRFLGAADPVAPLSTAAKNNTTGAKP